MHFLNIYPKRLWVTLNAAGAFEGEFTFDLEQYGLVTRDVMYGATVVESALMVGEWQILLTPQGEVEMPYFDKFVQALNYYVFEVLQLMPSRSAPGKDLPMIKLFFDDVYFDMSGPEPVMQKLGSQPAQN